MGLVIAYAVCSRCLPCEGEQADPSGRLHDKCVSDRASQPRSMSPNNPAWPNHRLNVVHLKWSVREVSCIQIRWRECLQGRLRNARRDRERTEIQRESIKQGGK